MIIHELFVKIIPLNHHWLTIAFSILFSKRTCLSEQQKTEGLLRLYKSEGIRESSRLECCPAFGQTILDTGTERSAFIFSVNVTRSSYLTLKMKALRYFETTRIIHQTPLRNITADYILQQYRCDSHQHRKTSRLDFFTQHGFHISPLTSFLGISIWWKTIQYIGYSKSSTNPWQEKQAHKCCWAENQKARKGTSTPLQSCWQTVLFPPQFCSYQASISGNVTFWNTRGHVRLG